MKLKSKEECIEAIKVINKTLLQLKSPFGATRKSQGDKFADDLIEQLKKNKQKYVEQLSHFS